MASLSTCLWLGWQILLNLVKSACPINNGIASITLVANRKVPYIPTTHKTLCRKPTPGSVLNLAARRHYTLHCQRQTQLHVLHFNKTNKTTIQNYTLQIASGQGSHWLIESQSISLSIYSPPLSSMCNLYVFYQIHTTSINKII